MYGFSFKKSNSPWLKKMISKLIIDSLGRVGTKIILNQHFFKSIKNKQKSKLFLASDKCKSLLKKARNLQILKSITKK